MIFQQPICTERRTPITPLPLISLALLLFAVSCGEQATTEDASLTTMGSDASSTTKGGDAGTTSKESDADPLVIGSDASTDGGGDICQRYCTRIISAGCAGGPPTVDLCTGNCRRVNVGTCEPIWSAMMECVETHPAPICVVDKPTFPGCEAEITAVSECKNSLPDTGS